MSPTFQAQHLFRSSAAPATLLLGIYPSEQRDAPATAPLWSSRGDSSKASESNLGPARYFQRNVFMCISGPFYCCLVKLLSRRNEQVWGAQKQKQDSFGNSNICLFFKDSKSPMVIWGLVCWSESLLQSSPEEVCPFTWCLGLGLVMPRLTLLAHRQRPLHMARLYCGNKASVAW